MDSEILLRLLPKEYEYKINNIKILERPTISSCCKDSLSVVCSPFPKNYKVELMCLFNFSKKLLEKVKVDFPF